MKSAKSLDEQIKLLLQYGVIINDSEKAKEILLDIGYYRLGFYFFPFETTHPSVKNRTHSVVNGTHFEDAVSLYYFDFDLRHILNRYLTRVEIAFRTYLTHYMSLKYNTDPIWFVNPTIINQNYINNFDSKVYNTSAFNKNPQISRHHKKYPNDKYAPAWKTLEFMTFGSIVKLYKNILSIDDKKAISTHFGIIKYSVFETYIEAIYTLRNKCAHGSVLFDLTLPKGISGKGINLGLKGDEFQKLIGTLTVLEYILNKISSNRADDYKNQLSELYCNFKSRNSQNVIKILEICSGIKI